MSTDSDDISELPEEYIEVLAELLLDLPIDEMPTSCTRCGRQDVTHLHDGKPYCELCRGIYDNYSSED